MKYDIINKKVLFFIRTKYCPRLRNIARICCDLFKLSLSDFGWLSEHGVPTYKIMDLNQVRIIGMFTTHPHARIRIKFP